jgi:hypothetical protein
MHAICPVMAGRFVSPDLAPLLVRSGDLSCCQKRQKCALLYRLAAAAAALALTWLRLLRVVVAAVVVLLHRISFRLSIFLSTDFM